MYSEDDFIQLSVFVENLLKFFGECRGKLFSVAKCIGL